jgi:hypothetical protein
MLHLPAERLAALADAEPTAAESDHLNLCARCASERAAYGRLLAQSMDERRRIGPPLNTWESLGAELRAQGLIAAESGVTVGSIGSRRPVKLAAWRSYGVRIAAGLLLVAGGAIAGRVSAGASMVPGRAMSPVSASATADTSEGFASNSEALTVLANAQREYQRAAAFLAAHDTSGTAEDASDRYRARLAALDQLANTSRAALYEAPEDPVLNQYYLSALGAREATIRQLGSVLPVGTRLTRF